MKSFFSGHRLSLIAAAIAAAGPTRVIPQHAVRETDANTDGRSISTKPFISSSFRDAKRNLQAEQPIIAAAQAKRNRKNAKRLSRLTSL